MVRLALEPLGWECVFANDISNDKAEMYRNRFAAGELSVRDIRDVDASSLPIGG